MKCAGREDLSNLTSEECSIKTLAKTKGLVLAVSIGFRDKREQSERRSHVVGSADLYDSRHWQYSFMAMHAASTQQRLPLCAQDLRRSAMHVGYVMCALSSELARRQVELPSPSGMQLP